MENLSSKTCLIYDLGQYTELASRLTREFGRVCYYAPWKSANPARKDCAVGEGIEGVERVYDLWDHIDDADLIVFPDVGDGDLQQWLRARGARVWGSAGAELLELDRVSTRELEEQIGVQHPAAVTVIGLDGLREILKGVSDKWVKINIYRDDFESFHHIDYFASKPLLDKLATSFGPLADSMTFLIQDNIADAVEVAYDGYSIDGEFPRLSLFGYEKKDVGYAGKVMPYASLPPQIRMVNDAFAPILRQDQCRSFTPFELRITKDGTLYSIDPTMRCPSPPIEGIMEMYENLGQILWEGAGGVCIDPQPSAKYVAIAMMFSEWAMKHWVPIEIPKEFRRWVKIKYLAEFGGHCYFVPQRTELRGIGSVVGFGNTLDDAIQMCNMVADEVHGYQLEITTHSLDKLQENIAKGQEYGIKFS